MTVAGPLDRYRYIRTLGSGGMGIVSLAQDALLDRPVALKRVSAMGGDQGLLRLRREALVGASVSHPNLVSIYDVIDSEDGEVIIAMEYVEGETLRDAVSRRGGLPAGEALRILSGAAAGLDAIHDHGIVHRDVKPANILLGKDGAVKVADLGIASVPDRTRLTTSGSVLGSLSYMAPEQLEEEPATPAIDVYALAAVAYEALSGEKARKEGNAVALAYAVSSQPPPDLNEAWPSAPAAAAAVLSAAMARDPARRPRSAGELVTRLQAALVPESTAPVDHAPVDRAPVDLGPPAERAARGPTLAVATTPRRARWWAAAPVLAVVALAGIAVAALSGGSSGSHRPSHAAASRGSTAATRSASSSDTTAHAPSTTSVVTPRGRASVSAVESFYRLAAAHRFAEAWALADPTFKGQLHGYQSFQSLFAANRSITFDSTRVVNQSAGAATVFIATMSVRTDGTQHCTGTVSLRSGGSSAPWLLHLIQVHCA